MLCRLFGGFFGDVARAMRAFGRLDGDFRAAEGARFGGWSRFFFGFLTDGGELVEEFHQQEDDKRHDDEIDDGE